MHPDSKRGRKSISRELLNARRTYTVGLRSAGMRNSAIQREVNSMAHERRWGKVSLRTIERDIAKYYEEQDLLTPEDYERFFVQREALLNELRLVINEVSKYTSKDKQWVPFERISALSTLFKMLCKYARLQNWDLSRKNRDFDFRHKGQYGINM